MSQNNKVGTKTVVKTKWRKAGIICTYEVYEAACGGIFTARLISYGTLATPEASWSEPKDSQKEAINAAYREWFEPMKVAQKRDQEYRATGGY